jgi:hypothetical protein
MEQDNKSENKDFDFKYMPPKTEVNVTIPYGLMMNMHALINYLIELYGKDKFLIFAKKHIDEKVPPSNELEIYITALSAFCMVYEQSAEEQGLTKKIKMSELEKLSDEEKEKLFNEN